MALKKLLAAGLASLVLASAACYEDVIVKATPAKKSIEEYVLDNAAESQVVMFGEVHLSFKEPITNPVLLIPYRRDNDFVIGLLHELRSREFSHLAIEIPVDSSGSYYVQVLHAYISGSIAKDDISPDFLAAIEETSAGWLDLIDAAKAVGMSVVPYDVPRVEGAEQGDLREWGSFVNIVDAIFSRNPGEKVIVYCGGLHINEKPYAVLGESWGGEIKWLGQYLDEYTGGQNFTVSFSDNIGINMPYSDFSVIFGED